MIRKHLASMIVALFLITTALPGAALAAPGDFADSGQALGSFQDYDVALGDVDGDGDLDAFVPNYLGPDQLYINDGAGIFTNSGQNLGAFIGLGAALGDLDGDGDLDAFVANGGPSPQPNEVWLNDGAGTFSNSGQNLASNNSIHVALGDLDGDGDLDAFVTNFFGQGDRVWLNDGSGTFTDSGQSLGILSSWDVDLGDADGDSDLDAFVGASGGSGRLYVNSGSGNFSDSGQIFGGGEPSSLTPGDVDGDGDLDVFVTIYGGPDLLYLNAGNGTFSDSGQSLGLSSSRDAFFGDVDGDGDIDVFVANQIVQPNQVWLNNGTGTFTDSGLTLGASDTFAVTLADLDGDCDLDAFAANLLQPDRIYVNDGLAAAPSAMFNPAAGTVDLSKVEIMGSPKIYQVQLSQIPGGPFLFQMTGVSKISTPGCPAATYRPATGILDIPYLGIMGSPKAYAVEMMKQPGAGYRFLLTNATKQ